MFQDAYTKLDKDATRKIVDSLRSYMDGSAFEPASTIVMTRSLPFYKNSRFLDIADHRSMPPMRRYAIQIGQETTMLDFTNSPIYSLNASVPIHLDADTVIDYVRFFFSFVRGRHGRFLIVESIDDIPWREEPPPAARKAVGKMIAPVTLTGQVGDTYNLSAQMMFKDSLFQAFIDVTPAGQVTIMKENLLVEDIPVIDDTLGQ